MPSEQARRPDPMDGYRLTENESEWNKILDFLLNSPDPDGEADYSSGLHRSGLTSEPSETYGKALVNARLLFAELHEGSRPSLSPIDVKFLQLQLRRADLELKKFSPVDGNELALFFACGWLVLVASASFYGGTNYRSMPYAMIGSICGLVASFSAWFGGWVRDDRCFGLSHSTWVLLAMAGASAISVLSNFFDLYESDLLIFIMIGPLGFSGAHLLSRPFVDWRVWRLRRTVSAYEASTALARTLVSDVNRWNSKE